MKIKDRECPAEEECPQSAGVSALVDGLSSGEELALIHKHLATCQPCSAQLEHEMQAKAKTDELRVEWERDRRFWANGVVMLGGAVLGAALFGVAGGAIGVLVGYAAARAAFGRGP